MREYCKYSPDKHHKFQARPLSEDYFVSSEEVGVEVRVVMVCQYCRVIKPGEVVNDHE